MLIDDDSFYDAMNEWMFNCISYGITVYSSCKWSSPRDLVEPAVHSTKNVLYTAMEVPGVIKVIRTSSSTAVVGCCEDGYDPALDG